MFEFEEFKSAYCNELISVFNRIIWSTLKNLKSRYTSFLFFFFDLIRTNKVVGLCEVYTSFVTSYKLRAKYAEYSHDYFEFFERFALEIRTYVLMNHPTFWIIMKIEPSSPKILSHTIIYYSIKDITFNRITNSSKFGRRECLRSKEYP